MSEDVEEGRLLEEEVKREIESLEHTMDVYLSTPATPNDRSERSSGEISRYILQDLLPSDATLLATFHITDLEPGEFGFQRIRKGSGDVNFNFEIPNSDIDGTNVGEGKGLLVVVQDVPFRSHYFVGEHTRALLLQVYLIDSFLKVCPTGAVGRGHTERIRRGQNYLNDTGGNSRTIRGPGDVNRYRMDLNRPPGTSTVRTVGHGDHPSGPSVNEVSFLK